MNDEALEKENKVQDIVAIAENIESKAIGDDENHIDRISIKILKIKLYVSLVGLFLGASYYTWSLIGRWTENNLQHNKIYVGIGLTIAIMIIIFCVAMLILFVQDKNHSIAPIFSGKFSFLSGISCLRQSLKSR